jgi:GT2 family glycosyltransferase
VKPTTTFRLRFLLASRGNPLLAELVALIAAVATDLGVASDVVVDAYPEPDPRDVYVIVPHELFELAPGRGEPEPAQLQRTIALCTEPPDSPSFDLAAHYAHQAAVALHTHRSGCEQLERRGIRTERFQLGYSSRWDQWGAQGGARDVDILHIGARDAWREDQIAGWAPTLWRHRCRFVLPQTLDQPSAQLAGLLPDGALPALRSARIVLNLHRRHRTHFEWPLALAAIANGCVLVSEDAVDAEPLVPGVHYLSGAGSQLARLAEELLADEERLCDLQRSAYELARRELPLARSVARLLELAAVLPPRDQTQQLSSPPSPSLPPQPSSPPSPQSSPPLPPQPSSLPSPQSSPPLPSTPLPPLAPQPSPLLAAPPPLDAGQRSDPAVAAQLSAIVGSLARLGHETLDLRRRLERIEHRMSSPEPADEPRQVHRSATFPAASPRVSVIVSLYEYEHEVRECLASVAASEFTDFEVLVLDDASRDGSLAAAHQALVAHPAMPALLLEHRVNQGVGRVRNTLIAHARGELVFVLDADNLIFPSTLQRLVAALDRDRAASFAYPMLVAHRDHRPVDVFNAWPWDPRELVRANYIDALALIRRDALLDHGGYIEDLRIGSEDHDLWCQLAERERYGVLVPELLAIYRIQAHSKLRTFGGSQNEHALARIRARVPGLMRRLAAEDDALAAEDDAPAAEDDAPAAEDDAPAPDG